MRPDSGFCIAPNLPKIKKNAMTSQFADMALSPLFDVVLFRLSAWGTDLSFMSISSLIMELWQFSFERDWPEIRKSEKRPPEFCPISGDWGKLEMPNLARMPLMKCYWMLQNYWVIKEKPIPEGAGGGITPILQLPLPQSRFPVKNLWPSKRCCISMPLKRT